MQKQFLFLGIGGMGMAPLAFYIRQQGHKIYGFDDALPVWLERLFEAQKIIICEQFPQCIDTVIFSSAIPEDHPWIRMAKERGIPLIRRGYFLAELCREKKVIAITGSHGKTTTTGMLIEHLPNCDYILGGFFQDKNKMPASYSQQNVYLVCEVDESDHTIASFHPYITAAINLEDDHLKAYGQSKYLDAAFETLFTQTQRAVVIPHHHDRLKKIAKNLKTPLALAKFQPLEQNENLWLYPENAAIVQKILEILAQECNIPVILKKVSYTPIFRRNQCLGSIVQNHHNIEIWADYAHHPTEIIGYIEQFQTTHLARKILFFFQPHRYSRTQQYARDFAQIFEDKSVIFLPVYSAGELPLAEGNTSSILQHFVDSAKVDFVASLDDFNFQQYCRNHDFPDVLLFIGAGDIFQQVEDWIFQQRIEILKSLLGEYSIHFREHYSLKRHNTFQIDAMGLLWIEPQSERELQELVRQLQALKIPHFIIGHGSNLLLDNDQCVLISLKKMPTIFEVNHHSITVSSEIALAAFSQKITTLGFQGCEMLACIPGTIGGALHMNAGAHQQFISDHLVSIRFLDHLGTIKVISKEQIKFDYRHGFQDGIILDAKFSFIQTESPQILLDRIKEKRQWRKERQPSRFNAGSVFKNPKNYFAGELIEQVGLKGFSIGGAKVSEQHANFIINHRNATANDIRKLIRLIRQKVFEVHGIFLEREIKFLSEFSSF